MGKLREIVDKADNTPGITEDVRESLHLLMSLAENKMNLLQDEIVMKLKDDKSPDALRVPITKIISTYVEARAITKEQTSEILLKVSKTIENMITDHSATGIVNGMAKLATDALDTVLGVGQGMERIVTTTMVTPDYPAIVRYDFGCWNRTIEAENIRKHCEHGLACVIYKSAVDVSKLSFNDFLAVYSPVLNAAFGSDPSKLKAMVKEAKKTYDQFKQGSNPGGGNGDLEPLDMDSAMKIVASHVKLQGTVLSAPQKATVGDF